MSEFQRNQCADGFGHDYAQGNRDRKLEISVEGKQDHENQHHSKGADKIHLRPGLEKLAVFAAPCHPITLRQRHVLLHFCLTVPHSPLQIAPFDAVLDPDVPGVIFTINKRRTVSLSNIAELAEWDLLPVWGTDQKISDLARATAELRLHADNKIEQLLSLNNLRHRLTTDSRGNHSFHVRNVDPISCNLVPIDVDQEARLTKFAHNGEIGEPGHLRKRVLDLYGFILKYVQIIAINFDCQRTLEPSQRLVHGIFRRLGIVENDSWEGGEFLIDRFDELFFLADLAAPCFVLVGLQTNVELAVKKAGRIRAIIGPP